MKRIALLYLITAGFIFTPSATASPPASRVVTVPAHLGAEEKALLFRDLNSSYIENPNQTVRLVFQGSPPKEFTVQKYINSGTVSDVYVAVPAGGGGPVALKIPHYVAPGYAEGKAKQFNAFISGSREIEAFEKKNQVKISAVKVLDSMPGSFAAVEFVDGEMIPLKEVNFALNDGVGSPDAEISPAKFKQMKLDLLKFIKEHSYIKSMQDLHMENLVWNKPKNGGPSRWIIMDYGGDASKPVFEIAAKNEPLSLIEGSGRAGRKLIDSRLGKQLNQAAYQARQKLTREMQPVFEEMNRTAPAAAGRSVSTAGNKGRSAGTLEGGSGAGKVCATCPQQNGAQAQKALERTVGKAGTVFGVVGGIIQAAIAESNPFAGEPTGIECDQANALKGKISCYWDSPLNPLNDIVYCYTIEQVRRQGRKIGITGKEICSIEFRFGGFRAESEAAKNYLEGRNYLDSKGVPFVHESMEEFIRSIRKAVPITDEVFKEKRKIPEPAVGYT